VNHVDPGTLFIRLAYGLGGEDLLYAYIRITNIVVLYNKLSCIVYLHEF